jgi:Na+/glutamate symporter
MDKIIVWFYRRAVVALSGVLGGVATLAFAFTFYGVPDTTTGVQYVANGAAPIGMICGCIVGGLIVFHFKKRSRPKKSN